MAFDLTKNLKKVSRIGTYAIALKDQKILLTEKKGGCYEGLLDLPGGGIEFGESPEEALRREFYEEVGMEFESMQLLFNLAHNRDVLHVEIPFHFHQLGQIYRVFNWKEVPNSNPEEVFGWYQLKDLNLDFVTPFTRTSIERLQTE